MEIKELQARRVVGSLLVKLLRQDTDPRAQAAADKLQEQQREINRLLVERIRAVRDVEPEPVVVGLRPVQLMGRAIGVGGGENGRG